MRTFLIAAILSLPAAAHAQSPMGSETGLAGVPSLTGWSELSPAGQAIMRGSLDSGLLGVKTYMDEHRRETAELNRELAASLEAEPFDATRAQRAMQSIQTLTAELTQKMTAGQLDAWRKLSRADRAVLARQLRVRAERDEPSAAAR